MELDIKISQRNTYKTQHNAPKAHCHFKKIEADGTVDPAELKPPDQHIRNQLYQLLEAKRQLKDRI